MEFEVSDREGETQENRVRVLGLQGCAVPILDDEGRRTVRRVSTMIADDRRILRDVFGFEDYREGQEPVVRALLSGRNALAVMPTG